MPNMKFNTTTKVNCLTFIDGIISLLARGGPGREGVLSKDSLAIRNLLPEWSDCFFESFTDNGKIGWRVIGESAYMALYFARAVYEVVFDAFPIVQSLPLESLFSLFFVVRSWPKAMFVKYAKFCTVWPMARYLKQDLPVVPTGFVWHPLLFTGSMKRILKNRLVSFNRHNLALWNSYLQGVKRGCAVVDESYVIGSYQGHQARMVAKDPMSEEFEDVFMNYTLRLIPNSSYPGVSISKKLPYSRMSPKTRDGLGIPMPKSKEKLLEASPSAAFEATRGMGGGREVIRNEQEEGLLRMVEIGPGRTHTIYGRAVPRFSEARDFALEQQSLRCAEVSAVLEPLKVRLITKGSAYAQWVSRFYQRALWSYLQLYPQFALTGRPMDISDLQGVLLRERKLCALHFQRYTVPLWKGVPRWVSGDYSAATDGMSITATKVLLEASLLCHGFSEKTDEVLRSVLYEQEIFYPKICKGKMLESVNQTNGQLMGSVLSFPILCMTNLISYWIAYERYTGMTVCPEKLPVLVNGDDILFRADDELYEIWQEVIRECGFELSLGKNYIHESVLVINSELFHYSEVGDTFRKVEFFNVGLLTGQSKLTGREETRGRPLPAIWNEIVGGACDQTRALHRFIHYWRNDVTAWTDRGNYNMFVPVWRGGLGMICPKDYSFEITSFQRRFATLLKRKQLDCYNSGRLPSGLAVGLLRELESSNPLYHHVYRVIEVPFGPLLENQQEIYKREVKDPILSTSYAPDIEAKLRLPRNLGALRPKTHQEFRNLPGRMDDRNILRPPPRIVETTEVVPLKLDYDSDLPTLVGEVEHHNHRIILDGLSLTYSELFEWLDGVDHGDEKDFDLIINGTKVSLNRDWASLRCGDQLPCDFCNGFVYC